MLPKIEYYEILLETGRLRVHACDVVKGPVDRVLRLRRKTHWHQDASFDNLLSRAGLGHLVKG